MTRRFCAIGLIGAALILHASDAKAARALGLDVSDWQDQNAQGPINWPLVKAAGKDFVFIRATRGGTTGTYNEQTGAGTGSYRYDDYAFEYNITNATSNGLFAGIYHFGRQDIVGNTGTDEANHMLEVAGPWMKPGYLLPVFDLEARQANATKAELSKFATDFANQIFAKKGIMPLVYINQNYAINYVDSSITIMPNWVARWPNQSNPDAIDIQNGNPPPDPPTANVYGVYNPQFPTIPNPEPWNFWQYTSKGRVNGIGNNAVNVDLDVAHGDIEFVKDFLVPALWMNDSNGTWTTISNWNTNVDPSGKGPAARLPGANDTVSLDRPNANIQVTLSSGTQNIRRLFTKERLVVSGGTLNVSRYAQFDNTGTVSSGKLSVGSMQVSSGVTFRHTGGTVAGILINNGTYNQSNGTASLGTITGTGTIIHSAGLMTANSIKQKRLTLSGGTLRINTDGSSLGTSVLNDLSITSTGRWDLNNNHAVIDYAPGSSPLATIKSLITTGYAGGAWNGAGGIDSTAAATASPKTALGYAEASNIFSTFPATFSGQTIDNSSVIIRYTLLGDANLSGGVDISDFNRLATKFGQTGSWYEGDFNYSGAIDILDFNLLATNFGKSMPTGLAAPAALRIAAESSAAVPLPTPVAAGACGLLVVAAVQIRSRFRG
ncbi:MAG TPA: GH25 family lysozyme [Tepidisphaeraceae bacterium]|jgi:lysozyme|nr:GH25 family lysozyme [Tepidisphaeraceae bacterium]